MCGRTYLSDQHFQQPDIDPTRDTAKWHNCVIGPLGFELDWTEWLQSLLATPIIHKCHSFYCFNILLFVISIKATLLHYISYTCAHFYVI